MSRNNSAVIALIITATLIVLIGLTGASTPQRSSNALANSASLALPPTVTDTPSPTTPTATATPQPTATLARREFNEGDGVKFVPTVFLPGRGPTLPGEMVYSGRRLDVYVGGGTFSADEVASLGVKAEWALSYIQKRFDAELTRRISVGVYSTSQAPGKGTRGIAYTYGDTNVRIYYRPGEDQHDALVVLSHEMAHALQAEAYGKDAQSRSDTVLLEGLASWISGEYWLSLSGATSFQSRARELYQSGYTGNLATLGRGSLDVAYDMWAGFVDYLGRTYGWEKFNRLYLSGRGRSPGSADYQGVYGKSFQELYTEWYATLK
ncbi:hypothetical protein EKD04_020345 [Chloroflexales bacterium ZM16-3]|nr:hypothetical protein [Chloroflexales bacterium ZM16-3]